MIRYLLLAIVFLWIRPAALTAGDDKSPPVVDFDTGISFACRDVTAKDFAAANPGLRIVRSSLANLGEFPDEREEY